MDEQDKKRRKREKQIKLQLRPKHKNTSSPYRGVYRSTRGWIAHVKMPTCRICLGPFETEKEAAIAFNRKEVALVGIPAVLNDIPNRRYRLMGREVGWGWSGSRARNLAAGPKQRTSDPFDKGSQ